MKSGSRNTIVTSDLRPETVEIWPFRACAMQKNMQYRPNRYYRNSSVMPDLAMGHHVPQNIAHFIVIKVCYENSIKTIFKYKVLIFMS